MRANGFEWWVWAAAVPERVVAPGEAEAQKAALKTSWELVCVLDFLSTFQPYLNLDHLQFSAEELESALVLSNGTGGLLVDLHIVRCHPFHLQQSFPGQDGGKQT